MGCQELLRLMNTHTNWRENEAASNLIAAHIHSCPSCHHGIVRLSKALIADDLLSCEQCRSRFPAYYEATRPDHPLVEMPAADLAETALHLGHCTSCREQYEVLVLLSEMEERDEMLDLEL